MGLIGDIYIYIEIDIYIYIYLYTYIYIYSYIHICRVFRDPWGSPRGYTHIYYIMDD